MKMLTSAVFAALLASSLALPDYPCNPSATVNSTVGSCECNGDQLYNYVTNECISEDDFYGTTYYCGLHGEFLDGECQATLGWTNSTVDGPWDTKIEDVCGNEDIECNSFSNDICWNDGSDNNEMVYQCTCAEGYYRQESNKQCLDIDEKLNAFWHDCPQTLRNDDGSYTCLCFNHPCFIDTYQNGTECDIDTANECESKGGTNFIQVKSKDEDEFTSFAFPGYEMNEDGTAAVDINECENTVDTLCWDHSTCKNAVGGYTCECDLGYTNIMDGEMYSKECFQKTCLAGTGLACEYEQCAVAEEEEGQVCVETGIYSYELRPKQENEVVGYDLDVHFYTGTINVVNGPIQRSTLQASLDILLGAGTTQVSSTDGMSFTVTVITKWKLTTQIKDILSNGCAPTDNPSTGHCYLPSGILVKDNLKMNTIDYCASRKVECGENHECEVLDGGRYRCSCQQKGTGNYVNNYMEVCTLQEKMQDDIDHYKASTIGVSVTLGIVCAAVIVLGAVWYFKFK